MNAPQDIHVTKDNRHRLMAEVTRVKYALEAAAGEANDAPAEVKRSPVLDYLCERVGLSEFERQVLLLCLGMEFEAGFGPMCARLNGNDALPFPTFGLALSGLAEASWDALTPQACLRYWQLIEVAETLPLRSARLMLDERILHFLLGLPALDKRLTGILRPVAARTALSET